MGKEINRRIRHYRKKSGITQNELAEMLGMKGSTYSQAEREGNITCDLLLRVAPILKVEPEVLLLGENSKEPPKPPITPPEPEHDFTQKEINIIKIFRYMSQEKRNILYKFMNELYLKK